MSERKIAHYGYIPSLPDHRDWPYSMIAPEVAPGALPTSTLRRRTPLMPPIYDQGRLGSCTANGEGSQVQEELRRQNDPDMDRVPSRLFLYYEERRIEGTIASDSGANPKDGIYTLAKKGICFEDGPDGWPYDISKFADQPPAACYTAARADKTLSYYRLKQDLVQMRTCLAHGYSFGLGFTVYESFESDMVAKSGVVSMPGRNEAQVGGHYVKIVDYDDGAQRFFVANSWGTGWGLPSDPGYFSIPYAYVLDPQLSGDFWTIRLVA